MPVNKKILIIAAILFQNLAAFCQYSANSPYSRYGVGDIDRTGFSQNRGMGGLAIGVRQPNQINFLNPASYTSQDSMSFIWDVGLFENYISANTKNSGSASSTNMNFDHLSLSVPVSKHYYASMGLVPYSNVGYNISETSTNSFTGDVNTYYKGTGNLNQFYFGNAFSLLKKQLNFGFNLSYIFGSINTNNDVVFASDNTAFQTSIERSLVTKGFHLSLGFQGVKKISNNLNLTGGITYDLKTKLKLDYTDYVFRNYSVYTDTLPKGNNVLTGNYIVPARFGIGLSADYKNKIIIGFDYIAQDWSKSSYLGSNSDSLKSSSGLRLGVQYTPNYESYRSYFEKIRYRLGGYYNDTYLNLKGNAIKDYGVTLGFGLPFKNNKTTFNFAVEMGSRGTTADNLVKMNYSRFSFGLTLYDFWFMKRKFD
jgi:hypothetical protein